MKRIYYLVPLFLLISFLFTACGPSSAGPTSWLDRPLDQTHHPLESIEIMAHASSDNGVSNFEISIDGVIVHQVFFSRRLHIPIAGCPTDLGAFTVSNFHEVTIAGRLD